MSTTVECEHCGESFDVGEAHGTFDGSTALYQCTECGEWTVGPPPS